MSYDYASAFGIHSVAAAAIFTAIYVPLGLWFVRQSIKNTTYVYIILTLFCAMRLTAFILRVVLASSTTQGSNENLFIADEVLFGVGFFALLYSAYSLVLDRDVIAGGEGPAIFSLNLLRNPHLFRILLTAGVAVSIVGITDSTSSNPTNVSTGVDLHKVGIAIFFVLTVVQVAQTAWYFKAQDTLKSSTRPFGDGNGAYLLCLISILMLVREVFFVATINNSVRQNEEQLWYPLVALPEFLAVIDVDMLNIYESFLLACTIVFLLGKYHRAELPASKSLYVRALGFASLYLDAAPEQDRERGWT
ncbi:hypothetical protein B0H12DRAFT_1325768 [Mycena haematopus]|nr:hypothetical protein B0H12DRAFT_1325768 [Mycena haematopus]